MMLALSINDSPRAEHAIPASNVPEPERIPINLSDNHATPTLDVSFLLVAIIIPCTLGTIMLAFGRCQQKNWLCEAPPFGEQVQEIISLAAGVGLLFESLSNLIKYTINQINTRAEQPTQLDSKPVISQYAAHQLDEHALSPIPTYQLPFYLIAPYCIGLIDNLFFTFISVVPILEKHATYFHEKRDNSHLVNGKLTVKDLQSINKLLNKMFIAALFTNSFSEISGLNYYPKLAVLVGLVGFVFFRQLTSIESGRLIHQQYEIKKTLNHLKFLIMDILNTPSPEVEKNKQAWEGLLEKLNNTLAPINSNTDFIVVKQLDLIFDDIARLTNGTRLSSLINNIMHRNDSTAANKPNYLQTRRFFQNHFPKQPEAVSHSNAVGIGLIILNLFLPNLISNGAASPASTITSNVLLSIATFMPLNGLTEWENELWGLNKLIRSQEIARWHSLMIFLVVNLPKLQGLSGAVEGVGISTGNTQISLVCESINMFMAFLRSLVTMSVAIKNACSPDDNQVSTIGKLSKLM